MTVANLRLVTNPNANPSQLQELTDSFPCEIFWVIFESIKLRSFPFKALVILTKVLKCYYGPVSRQIWIASYGLYAAFQTSKSAITHTLAEMWKNQQWLLATFFFWKTAAERGNADRFVVTIAYQIARAIPTLRPIIESGVDNSMVVSRSRTTRLRDLL